MTFTAKNAKIYAEDAKDLVFGLCAMLYDFVVVSNSKSSTYKNIYK